MEREGGGRVPCDPHVEGTRIPGRKARVRRAVEPGGGHDRRVGDGEGLGRPARCVIVGCRAFWAVKVHVPTPTASTLRPVAATVHTLAVDEVTDLALPGLVVDTGGCEPPAVARAPRGPVPARRRRGGRRVRGIIRREHESCTASASSTSSRRAEGRRAGSRWRGRHRKLTGPPRLGQSVVSTNAARTLRAQDGMLRGLQELHAHTGTPLLGRRRKSKSGRGCGGSERGRRPGMCEVGLGDTIRDLAPPAPPCWQQL